MTHDLRHLVLCAALASACGIFVLGRAEAADCSQASARSNGVVNTIVCASPELVWLDGLMKERYRRATVDTDQLYTQMKRPDLLEKERERRNRLINSQRTWVEKLAECRDESCMRAAYYSRLPQLLSIYDAQHVQEPKFKVTSGKGWAVCETHARLLNEKYKNSEIPLCDLHLDEVPGMKQLPWEEIPVQDNLRLLFQVETAAKTGKKWPVLPDFDSWQADVEWRSKAGFVPRLRKVETLIAQGLPLKLAAQLREAEKFGYVERAQRLKASDATSAPLDTILAYDEDQKSCPIQRVIGGDLVTGSYLFRLDPKTGQLSADAAPLSFSGPRFIVRFRDEPYTIRQDVGAIQAENPKEFFSGASIQYSRLYRLYPTENRDTPPRYASEDICAITYVVPVSAR